jgi:hypothetical protein
MNANKGRSSYSGSKRVISLMIESRCHPCNFRRQAMMSVVCEIPSRSAMYNG